ncbi:ER lumen protein-retaining receptor erd-2.2-like [Sitophilus oryzae]|uniref:ER lumen protein-retaining receptor erd-2.2-like n=1 Tax=Sitophilus oryzae TaxID=7048 RepID=A0A6J2XG43_SITOR|nr:ER lumen protein-retaining receptor erd-2.2-like [Sitophilus oryzae]
MSEIDMNYIILVADCLHVVAILPLLANMKFNKTLGISQNTLLLFAMAFGARFFDIFLGSCMHANVYLITTFIAGSYAFMAIFFFFFSTTDDRKTDRFSFVRILVPSTLCGILLNHVTLGNHGIVSWDQLEPCELTWATSIYMEAAAIVPQYQMIKTIQEGRPVRRYVIFLILYRILYTVDGIYRYYFEDHTDPISFFCGLVEIAVLLKTFLTIRHMAALKKPRLTV